ncbi:MAG: helix-turn-helix transcriptional regulator [Anaerolineales bacterium]|nr:helix-turn-helix transcriptional regulator [Anaerolineales bacterium]
MAQFKSEIGSNVKAMLGDRGMTIKDFAEAADMHYTTARRFVAGDQENISKTVLAQACRALGCMPGDLFVYVEGQSDGDHPSR